MRKNHDSNHYSKEMLRGILATMLRIRKFETKAVNSFTKGLCAGNIHPSLGQEATAAGAAAALEARDRITSTHRGHGHCLAKGARADKAMAELFGKATGYCGGKGGSMHIADVGLGILGANGIVAAGIPIATGAALASKIRGTDEVTLCFFGDGASNNGTFHESVNMAAAWKLPVVFLCENNRYAVSVPIRSVTNTDTIAVRAKAYDIPGVTVDGNDPLAVYEAVKEAVDRARAGSGPSLVECMTYRHTGHYCGDPAQYRPASYLEEARKNDAIARFSAYLLSNGFTQTEVDAMDKAAHDEIEAAFAFAQESPYPDVSTATTDVYASDNARSVAR
jgi:pyruvate dehydrogenase E1 component alpha subunit